MRLSKPALPPCCLQNCMTKDVFNQLQKISVQQSKIKSVKSRLSVYQDVANKHAETFAELQLVKRVPVAYRHCLAECMRRFAFRLAGFALKPSCVAYWFGHIAFWLVGSAIVSAHSAFWPGGIAKRHCLLAPTCCLSACRLCFMASHTVFWLGGIAVWPRGIAVWPQHVAFQCGDFASWPSQAAVRAGCMAFWIAQVAFLAPTVAMPYPRLHWVCCFFQEMGQELF